MKMKGNFLQKWASMALLALMVLAGGKQVRRTITRVRRSG
jgi:hypothetical protein